VSAVVIHHQVQFQLRSVLGIDLTQEAQEFLVPVPWKAAAAIVPAATFDAAKSVVVPLRT